MADDMGKIDKSEPYVNISGYAALDGESKSVHHHVMNQSWCVHRIVF